MKTGVWISLILLAMTIGLGMWSGEEVRALSEEYVASAEELRTLAEAENWAGAEAALQKCQSVWKQKVPWLQTLINHDDVDAVTTALKKSKQGFRRANCRCVWKRAPNWGNTPSICTIATR